MHVIRVINNATADFDVNGLTIPGSGGIGIFPADYCAWTLVETTQTGNDGSGKVNKYRTTNAIYVGAPDGTQNGVVLNGTNRVVNFGQLGRGGNFVAIN